MKAFLPSMSGAGVRERSKLYARVYEGWTSGITAGIEHLVQHNSSSHSTWQQRQDGYFVLRVQIGSPR